MHRAVAAWLVEKELIERASPRVALGEERGEVEEVLGGGDDGGELELGRLCGTLSGLLEDGALGDPRRDEHCGGAEAKATKVKHLAALWPHARHDAWRLVCRHALVGRYHVVVVPAGVVVRDEEERPVPLGGGSQRLVHVLEQPLALGNVVTRVVARLDGGVDPAVVIHYSHELRTCVRTIVQTQLQARVLGWNQHQLTRLCICVWLDYIVNFEDHSHDLRC